tara:strand:- start:230 stop:613 length:384 start_codon:yes stop_codon:yes gene_type:complete
MPYCLILIDRYIFFEIEKQISTNFILYYTLIISIFIGSINWNLLKKIPNTLIVYGFLPSFFSIIIIILNLYNFNTSLLFLFLIIFLVGQLFFDYVLIFKELTNKNAFYFLRLPLTFLISIILIILQF